MQKYSVLMAVYIKNNPDYFAVALDSMIHQTIPPDEIVIVKDGLITEALQSVIDERKKGDVEINEVALEENHGLGYALNVGIRVCRNELIARMDADDYSLPTRCELQLVEFEKNPSLDIIGCFVKEFVGDIEHITGERKVPLTQEEIYRFEKIRNAFNHPTVIYKKTVIEQVGGYNNYKKNQDLDLWNRIMEKHAVCMNLPESLVYFRFDDETYRRRKAWYTVKTMIEIRYKAWRRGFNTLSEFFFVAVVQIGIYVMPEWFQRLVYKKILRV